MPQAAIVGAGLVGQGWAIVFARAGWRVRVFDANAEHLAQARKIISQQLQTLQRYDLVRDAAAIDERVTCAATLEDALAEAVYVQESVPEDVALKRALYTDMDNVAASDAILASSTSSIPASRFTDHLANRRRCLVAHPVNPPYLVPVVELCGAPWTAPEMLDRAGAMLRDVGQRPILVRREIEGFVLNRLQGALLQEAMRLVRDGVASVEDIDATVKDGLGLRWSFMGPFETIDLNAPQGIGDYCARYGGMYASIAETQKDAPPWTAQLAGTLEGQRRQTLPGDAMAARRFWRDEQLMRLARHRNNHEREQSGETNG